MRATAGQAADLATLLSRAGAAPHRPLGSASANPDLIARLAVAAWSLGKPFFPLDPALPAATKRDLLAQAGVDLVVGDEEVPGLTNLGSSGLLSIPAPRAPRRSASETIALIIATSGSTGEPKGVMLTHGNLEAAARCSAARTPLGPGDRWLACLPLHHIGGFSILTRCADAGATPVLAGRFDPDAVLARLRQDAISHLSLVPVMLAQLLEASREAASPGLRHVLVGGAALSPSLAEEARALGWPIQPTYGMSETASQVATLASLPAGWRRGHVGRPLPGIEVALDGEQRLKVRGPVVMAGYANPDLRPGDGIEDGWLVTSDIAEIAPEGDVTILGRADDVIVTGGKKVHPAAVERLLEACPGVAEACVTGRPDPVWGETVVAIFRGSARRDEVLAWAREHLPPAWRPRRALEVAALPRLSSGKPDRSALRRLAEGLDAEAGAERKP